jgi:hypothetical protein
MVTPPPPRAETLLETSELSQQASSAFAGLGVGVPPPPPPHLKVTKDFAVALGGGALPGYNRVY